MQTNKQHSSVLLLTQMAVLIAIMLVLETTGLGMIKIGLLEMTILQFPVIVGAITMGPAAGAGLGLVFGLISFWECFGKSAFGATLLGINPIFTFLVCVPTRTLMGLLCGMTYKAVHGVLVQGRTGVGQVVKMVPYVAASLAGALLNTAFFMGTLVVLFGSTEFIRGYMDMAGTTNPIVFICWFVGIQGLVEALLCAFLGTAVSRGVNAVLKK
ncbi:MAG: ECF transporter S component [Oscillospiraceae bacterium]|nr:ECF transporter S component [Oscillospiraceae bacterium]